MPKRRRPPSQTWRTFLDNHLGCVVSIDFFVVPTATFGFLFAWFTFPGFTHYCGKTKKGKFKVKRRTSRKKLGQSLQELGEWARKARCYLRKGEMLRAALRRIAGHLNYYAITDNSDQCTKYVYYATRLVFKWINRKSQRRAYTWTGFNAVLTAVDWPKPRTRKDLSPFRRAEVL